MKTDTQYYVVYEPSIKRWLIVNQYGNRANDVRYKSQKSASNAKWFLFEREGRKIIQQNYKAKRGLSDLEKHWKQI